MEKGNQAGSQIAKKRAWDKMAGQKSRILPLGLFFFPFNIQCDLSYAF